MILFFVIFILIPIIANAGDEFGPSYRSSITEGGKPILRGGESDDAEVNEVSEDLSMELDQWKDQPGNQHMVRDFKLLLAWLVNDYGYEIVSHSRRQDAVLNTTADNIMRSHHAKSKHTKKKKKTHKRKRHGGKKNRRRRAIRPKRRAIKKRQYIRKLKRLFKHGQKRRQSMYGYRRNDGPEKEEVKELEVKEKDVKEPEVKEEDVKELEVKEEDVKELEVKEEDVKEEPTPVIIHPVKRAFKAATGSNTFEPAWKIELKEFMRDLIGRVGRSRLDRYTRPVVRAIESKHQVTVADIDVDQFGHIFVDYADLTNPKLRNKIIVDKGKRIIRDDNAKRSKHMKSNEKRHSKHSKSGKTSHKEKDFVEWSPES